MANDAKRLRMLERQHRITMVGRREALAALAQANATVAKSAALATRSRMLARQYGSRLTQGAGLELTQNGAFAGSLARIAKDADQSEAMAAQACDQHAGVLATNDQKLERLDERISAKRRDIQRAHQIRETTDATALARKLLRKPMID
ncbi:MAG: hypothetical protein ABJP48_09960 [Erythrobacter sp.]